MTNEDIEKAAFKFGIENQVAPGLGGELRIGFIAGAEWRINSVWHNKEEIPDLSQDILIIFKNEICTILIGAVHTLSELKHYDYTNWAYVKDLIPIKEDEK